MWTDQSSHLILEAISCILPLVAWYMLSKGFAKSNKGFHCNIQLGVSLKIYCMSVCNLTSGLMQGATPQASHDWTAGNAPTLLSWQDLKRVCPQWLNTSLAIYNDKESRAAWGWVQEMYALPLTLSHPYTMSGSVPSACCIALGQACA